MRMTTTLVTVFVLLSATGGVRASELSADAQNIVDYLFEDWGQRMHATSIALAMKNLGIGENDDLRIEVGDYFRSNNRLHKNITYWGANNYILSNEEKRIAKWLIVTFERENRVPGLPELANGLGLPEEALKRRLAFMARTGLLEASNTHDLGYQLIQKYSGWGGPLRFNFHTVRIGDGKPFDVW
jgi:hypothetical protein